jgi:penicillin amidase
MEIRLPCDFAPPWRVRRIRRLLAARDDWDVNLTLRLQQDTVSERAMAMLKLLREDLEAHGGPSAEVLLDWDGRMEAMAVAPHVYSRLLLDLGRTVGSHELRWRGGLGAEELARLLAGGLNDGWWDDPNSDQVETRAEVVAGALDSLDESVLFQPWGDVHQVFFKHPLTEIPVVGRFLAHSWNRGPFPSAGDNVTIAANYWSVQQPFSVAAMPALRMVNDVGNWDESVVVMPIGQSGRPWSSHYADQIQLWRRGEAFALPFSDAAVEAATEARLVLRPDAR